ncbi:redoxin family protein [Agromyces mediolanus]|uniref:redoxin family protein n=1 Tax=Agromyces mediolanus TaxID=41986 RepID=UPI0038357B04
MRTRPIWLTAAVAGALVLTGCTTNDSLAEQYRAGDGKGYVAGDGTITEIPAAERGERVTFNGELEAGGTTESSTYLGQVMVVNFWYAGCAPCRAEAPQLETLSQKYRDQGVVFLGVNVRDQAGTAMAFTDAYGITYPSILDVNDGNAQLAFSGTVAPNAVPTTVVLDREGRVASRILGQLQDESILDTLIASTLAETPDV